MKAQNSIQRWVQLGIAAICVIAAICMSAYAQVDTGAIAGTVRDQSGAVIPHVKVSLLNQETGLAFSALSDAGGNYTFSPVRIGTYTVTAEYQGFQKATHPDVVVSVQQQVEVDFTLQPGQVTETVNVTSAVPLLQTQNAAVGQTVGSQQVNDLPLNGRNYTFLAQLSAGVAQEAPTGRGLEGSGTFVANGLPSSNNDYILDGIDNNNDSVDFLNGASYAIKPPVDAIQEFKVQTSNFSAEFGRAGGAVLNATIKSGTNHLHGDAWEFLRNDVLDAANFFENSPTHVAKGAFRQNQFGFTIGGPVYIPHVYNGRDKTFFFFDYEGTRIDQAETQVATVPTTLERSSGYTDMSELISDQSGTRTDLLNRTTPVGTVFDPATTRAVTAGVPDPVTGLTPTANGFVRDPFTNNQLPANRLDSNAISLLNLYPSPTRAGLFSNYTSDRVATNNTNQFDVRVDHNFSDKDQIFGRFSYADNPNFVPGPFTSYADSSSFSQDEFHNNSISAAVSETHSFTPTTINEFRVGYSRLATSQFQPFANQMGIPAQFGIQGIPQLPHNGGLPFINIEGMNNLGPAGFVPGERFSETAQLTDNLTKIYGAHSFKGGIELQRLRFPWFAPAYPRGYFGFDGTYTEVPSTSGGNTGLAQLLLSPTATSVANGINNVGGSDTTQASNYTGPDDVRSYYGLYFQDSWRAKSKLTVELGLRWEFFGQVRERYGAQANFIPAAPGSGAEYLIPTQRQSTQLSPSFPATLTMDGIKLGYSSEPGLTNTPLNNFAPRVSIAYQATNKLVVRAGYGIYYAGFTNIGGSPDIGSNYPFLFNFAYYNPDPGHPITYPNGTLGTLENGLSAIPLTPANVTAEGLALEGIQTSYKTPYTQEYNVSFQYQLTPNQTVQLGYIGNTSRHLENSLYLNGNNVILPPGQNPQNFVAFPDFARTSSYITTNGDGYYDALQLTFERRFSEGLNLLANYTYSECRTDEANLLGIGNNPGFRAPYLPNFGVQGDYTRCGDQSPNVVHLSGIYQLPFGRGRRFASSASGAADQIIGGWSLNVIATLTDGFPNTIGCPIGTTANFGCNALLVPGQNMYAGPHNVNQWLNPAAFANPPVATTIGQSDYAPLGGAPGQYLSPGYHRLDLSLFKQFRTSESTRLEFRAEFFNLTNTPQFSQPAYTDFTNTATFGQINSLRDGANDPRQIQFALKFYF